jgi:hypothetical protein
MKNANETGRASGRDRKRLVATVSKPGLFLFQNREFSCIHCATGFGEMRPGQTAEAINMVYFVAASLATWQRRMETEMHATLTSTGT